MSSPIAYGPGYAITASGGGTGTGGSFSAGVSSGGNTAGTTGTVSNGILFVGGSNITLSQSSGAGGATITWIGASGGSGGVPIATTVQSVLSANSVGTVTRYAAEDHGHEGVYAAGVSSGGNTLGATTVQPGRLVLAGGNNITLSVGTAAGALQTVTFIGPTTASQTVQPAVNAAGVSNTGTTAGNTGTSSGMTLVFAGSGNITASQSTAAGQNTVWFSVPAQTVQPAVNALGVSNTGTTAGNTGTVSGVTWVFGGSGNITASQSTAVGGPNTVWYSVPAQSVQAESFSIGVSNVGNTQGNTTVQSGSRFVLVGTNGITLSQATGANSTTVSISGNAAQTTQPAINALGVSNTGTTAGNTGSFSGVTFAFGASGNITASQSTTNATGPHTIWYSVPAQTVQANSDAWGVSNTGTTAGNTGTTNNQTLVFAGSGNITASQSTAAGQRTIWYSVPAQTVQPAVNALGVSNTGTTAGNTGSFSGVTWVFGASGNITASESTTNATGPHTIWYSVPAQTSQSAIKGLGVSNTGNTAGNTGLVTGVDWVVAGSANITVNQSTAAGGPNTIWITGPSPGAAQYSVGVSNLGNTSNQTGVTGTRIVFAGINNITLSQNTDATGATITISGPTAGAFSAGISTAGNTAGSTGVTGTRLVLVGTNDISLSQSTDASGGTISFKGNEGTISFLNDMVMQNSLGTVGSWGQSSVYVQPMPAVMCPAIFDRAIAYVSHNFSATNAASSQGNTLTLGIGIYTRSVSTLNLASSGSSAFVYTVTGSTSSSSYQGWRAITVPLAATLTPGDYWVGIVTATNSAGNAIAAAISNMGFVQPNSAFSGMFGAATNQSIQVVPGIGTWTNQSASVPAAINFADLRFAQGVIFRSRPAIAFANGTF